MGQKLIQEIDLEDHWPEYGFDGEGQRVRLADVERLYPAGLERELVHFTGADGREFHPWRDIGYSVDEETGKPVQITFDSLEELLAATPNLTNREPVEGGILAGHLGFSDADLDELHVRYLGTPAAIVGPNENPHAPAAQRRRRAVFDAVMVHAYRQD